MNIVSTIVGITIMGVAAPSVMNMTLAPIEAQKRAQNFSSAETSAVTFAANNEGQAQLNTTNIPADCLEKTAATPLPRLQSIGNNAYEITCEHGQGRYLQTVKRAFKLAPSIANISNISSGSRSFPRPTPTNFFHSYCYLDDPWGLDWFDRHPNLTDACKPRATETKAAYLSSDPDSWLYDINKWDGWNSHPDY